jgi:hypothetical protein
MNLEYLTNKGFPSMFNWLTPLAPLGSCCTQCDSVRPVKNVTRQKFLHNTIINQAFTCN